MNLFKSEKKKRIEITTEALKSFLKEVYPESFKYEVYLSEYNGNYILKTEKFINRIHYFNTTVLQSEIAEKIANLYISSKN